MSGGLAVRKNLLCVSYTSARGKVFLFDLEERHLVSHWELTAAEGGYSDAGGVAMDDAFGIYVADTTNDQVRRYSAFGKPLGRLGLPPERDVGAVGRDRPGVLDRPRDVSVCGDTVFVACGERKLRRGVQCFSRDGDAQKPLAAFGDVESRFGAPRGVHADPSGIFVADTLHGAVQRFRRSGLFVGQFSTARSHDEASRPIGIAMTAAGTLLVADAGDRPGIVEFTVGGELQGTPAAIAEHVERPLALACDERGFVYVLDRDGERVQRFHPDLSYDTDLVDLIEILDDL